MGIELEELVEFAIEHGLKRLSVGEIGFEFWDKPRVVSQAVPESLLVKDKDSQDDGNDLYYSVRK